MNIIRGPKKIEFCTSNFPSWVNDHFDTKNFCWIEVTNNDSELYKLLCKYGTEFCKKSFRGEVNHNSDVTDKNDNPLPVIDLTLGSGLHKTTFKGKTLYLLHATTGEPIGTDCGVVTKDSIHVFMEGADSTDLLKEYFNDMLAREVEDTPKDTFRIYRWHNKYQYWMLQSTNDARSIQSVVLPKKTKSDLLDDMSVFLSKKTKQWYKEFGIPYKRSYIFYGPPGTGKTSMIQALAGAYQRNVCFLQPNGNEFTDDAFKNCLQKLPAKSILVLEDIDALFHCRQSRNAHCPLTFTGLLNGLDGIGNPSGQIFILTTNHLEHLDPALIRCGRVDLKFEFGFADDFQICSMFKRFYPLSTKKQSDQFCKIIRSKSNKVVMADLQQIFILNMRNTAVQCLKFIEEYKLTTINDLREEMKNVDKKIKKERAEKLKAEKEKEALEAEREKKKQELVDKKIKKKIEEEFGVEEKEDEKKDKKEETKEESSKKLADDKKTKENIIILSDSGNSESSESVSN